MNHQKDFIQLIQSNQGILYKISGIYTDNNSDSKDLRQEMIFQLWKSYKSFKGQSKISTWLYKVCLNTALVFVKKNNQIMMNIDTNETDFQFSTTYQCKFDDQVQQLYQTIKKLNKIDKSIILLHLEGHKYDEIAEIIGFNVSNIGTRLGRIKNKLTKLMQGNNNVK